MFGTFLRKRLSSFTFLNLTQFLGALNDNIYKLLIAYFLIGLEGQENSTTILALTGAIFVIPFLLFSAASGTLADRYSKSTIIVATKILEVVTMSLGLLAFLFELKIGSYIILFLMSAQSAIFGPSKYGILPEIVPNDKISQANGLMSFFTYFAIILGTFLASFMTDITDRNFVLSCMFCVIIALIGLGTSYYIEYTPPSGSKKKVSSGIISDIYKTLKRVWYEAPAAYILMAAIFSSGYFLFVGSYMQLSLIPYAIQVMGLTDVQGGYLFLVTALGIGTGSFAAGQISGKGVELGLIPIAALGMTVGFFLLEPFSQHTVGIAFVVLLMGVSGGLFLVPLDTYIQVNSPKILRGQIIAATNFISFLFVLLASLSLALMTDLLGIRIDDTYLVLGIIALLYTIFVSYLFFDFMTRFVGMVLCKLHFNLELAGTENIPSDPAVYIAPHTAWNDTLLLLGSQRRRIRFFIREEQPSIFRRLYKLLRTIQVPTVEPIENNRKSLHLIKKSLRRGISVCILVNQDEIEGTIEKMKHSELFHDMLDGKNYPIIPLQIEKGEKASSKAIFEKLLRKIKCPARVTFGKNALPT